jgi:DNA invertase Pin-like site-specific DNA recombinase
MSLIEKLPAMTDVELATLKANADALAASGTDKQKNAAAALMPALEAELNVRRERAAAERAAKPKRKLPVRRKKAAEKSEAEEGVAEAAELGGGAAE